MSIDICYRPVYYIGNYAGHMKRLLFSLLSAGIIGALAFGLTQAFFSDTETSTGNVLAAGKLDLKIDNTSYLNHATSSATTWTLDDLTDQLFFNFLDLKPSDEGEDTISIHVDDNDAWACMDMTLTKDDDVDCTEPELADDPSCTDPGAPGNTNDFDGELGGLLNFIFWTDDGDNVLETGEPIIASGSANTVLDEDIILADANENNVGGAPGDPLTGGQTYFIGKAWCFGTLTPNPVAAGGGIDPTVDSGVLCDGSSINNASQTDSVMADISFRAVQHRNNPNFTCSGQQPSITPTPSITVTPTPLACGQADVMLVLDRSGSISGTELGQLKTAAKDFVDALAPTLLGIHVGESSFATTGSLDHHLSENGASVKAAIDLLVASGFTNLKEGIDLAKGEFDNPGDGHDRVDLTSPDKMIIITDGHPNRPLPSSTADDVAKTAADNARAAGVEIFVVGVGSDVNTTYLQNDIADPGAGHYFSVSDYSGLETTLQNLDLCNGG